MYLVGTRGQQLRDFTYDASGVIATPNVPQLVLPERKSCSSITIQNLSSTGMYLEIGAARATCTITSGQVSTNITITNGGFGYTIPPEVRFYGGGNTGWNMQNSTFLGCGDPNYPSPSKVAKGRAVLTAGVVTSIVLETTGQSYATAPMVFLSNSLNDPYGCANPYYGSVYSGIYIAGNGGSYTINGTVTTTDPISIVSSTSGGVYTCKWTT